MGNDLLDRTTMYNDNDNFNLNYAAASSESLHNFVPPVALDILVAEPDPIVRQMIETTLANQGHTVTCAADGLQAVTCFEHHTYDLVLMDLDIPGLDGFEATAWMKRLADSRLRWVPILILSEVECQDLIVKALSQGAEDFIPKPLRMQILSAKIAGFSKSIQAYRQILDDRKKARRAAEQLGAFNQAMREEMEMANQIMNRLVSREHLSDPLVRHFLRPAAGFSGDVVAMGRSSSGTLYVMLADARGHGLTAAITVLPAVWVFEGMVRKDALVPEIAAEINRRLKATLPTGHFVAAHIASINVAARTLRLWSGGMPPALLADAASSSLTTIPSRHPALGIVGNDYFDPTCEVLEWSAPRQFLLYSDGVSEAQTERGPMFGEEAVQESFRRARGDFRLDAVVKDIEAHLAGGNHLDDMSILNIRLGG